MNERAFLSLVGVEIRRGGRQMLRLTGALAVVIVALAATGTLTREGVGFFLGAIGLSCIGLIPGGVLKDKLGGTMEFLATLPVSASTVVGARFVSAILFGVPGAVMIAAASGLVLYPLLEAEGPGRVVVVSFLFAWAVLAAVACSLAGLLIRFNVNTLMTRAPILLMVLLFGGGFAFEKIFGHPVQAIRAVLAHGQGMVIAGAALVLGTVGACAASFYLARKGVENYRPQPDSIDW